MPDQDAHAGFAYQASLAEDATDRRAALEAAAAGGWKPTTLGHAQEAYGWLRARPTLALTGVSLIPGIPYPEGTTPVATAFNLSDVSSVNFTLDGRDAKNAPVPLPAGYTAAWTLADPDSTGAVLAVSADTTNATVSAGVPDSNLMLSVAVTITNPDGSTSVLAGAEAIIVQASDATTVGLVPGTPTAE